MPSASPSRPRGRPRTTDATDARAYLRIGAAARLTGLTPRAIRHYEALGLLRPAARVEGGNRLYDPDDLDRLRDIRRLRDVLGFSLAEIGELLETEDQRRQIRADLSATPDPVAQHELLERSRAIVVRRLGIVEAKLAQLHAFQEEESARLARIDERLGRPASLV